MTSVWYRSICSKDRLELTAYTSTNPSPIRHCCSVWTVLQRGLVLNILGERKLTHSHGQPSSLATVPPENATRFPSTARTISYTSAYTGSMKCYGSKTMVRTFKSRIQDFRKVVASEPAEERILSYPCYDVSITEDSRERLHSHHLRRKRTPPLVQRQHLELELALLDVKLRWM